MKEQIKIGLLAVIAITLIVNTLLTSGGNSQSSYFNPEAGAPSTQAAFAANGPSGTQGNPIQLDQGFNPSDPAAANAANPTAPDPISSLPKTTMSFGELAHDFGAIKQNSENVHVFQFTNTGAKPLQISNAKGSCGCTVPKYPKEPIPPGQTGEIEVVYKPGLQKDAQTKTVTITANTEPETMQLKITANVQPE